MANRPTTRGPLGLAAGGAIGAVLRLLLNELIPGGLSPWTMLAVNVGGCFLMGLLTGLAARRWKFPPLIQMAASIGVSCGFTVFSDYAMSADRFVQPNEWILFSAFMAASAGLGLLAIGAATKLTRFRRPTEDV